MARKAWDFVTSLYTRYICVFFFFYLRYTRAPSAVIDAAERFRPVCQRNSWGASVECEGKRGKEEKEKKEKKRKKKRKMNKRDARMVRGDRRSRRFFDVASTFRLVVSGKWQPCQSSSHSVDRPNRTNSTIRLNIAANPLRFYFTVKHAEKREPLEPFFSSETANSL